MFRQARVKLTIWYLLIAMLISISFSVVIYQATSTELDRFASAQRFRIERRFLINNEGVLIPPPPPDRELINETKQRFLFILLAINSGIIIFSGCLGYFLSGRTLRPISEMIDEQNRFISDSSHELRTPLTSLKSALEVNLRDKNLNLKEAKILISESITEVNKLQVLSDSLLILAQYQKPNLNRVVEKISLKSITDTAIHKIKPLALVKKIKFDNKITEISFYGYPYEMTDLLVIFLDNAVKYSGLGKTVILTSAKYDSFFEIYIQDQGIGIETKDLTRIFDRFYRADSARSKTSTNGYGLGLSIAKKIVDLHHGSITASSIIGKGTTFIIKLPLNLLS